MALVTANQFQLQADPDAAVSGFSQGLNVRKRLGEEQRLETDAKQQANNSQFAQKAISGNQEALESLAVADPKRAKEIQSFLANQSDAEREESVRENEALTRSALNAMSLPPEQRREFLQNEQIRFKGEGRDTSNIERALSGNDQELDQAITFQARIGQEVSDIAKAQFGKGTVGTASQRDFETFQRLKKEDPKKAEVFGRQAGFIRETEQEKADIEVSKTEKKEIIKQRVKRTSDIKKELSERNRGAARSGRTLRQALTLAKTASQGLGGSAKLQLSRLVPGIDVTDEAGLDATLKQLALEQLQLFKGPTTDFEFGVTQSIAGALGSSQASNIARIKSLDRARFFNEKELSQFNQFIKDKGNPDNFSFNFNEVMKTKKGPFTLQSIQDTAVENNLTIEETIQRLNQ